MSRFFVLTVCSMLSANSFAADSRWEEVFLSQRLRSVLLWATDDGDLVCGAQEKGQRESTSLVLSCFTKASGAEKKVSNVNLDPGTTELRALPVKGSPLLVSAGTGSGYAFRAYTYVGGQVKKVWEGGSFMPAETFTPDKEGNETILALADPEWHTRKDGAKEKVIGRARLFRWTGVTFESIGEASWEGRYAVASDFVAKNRR